MLKRFFLSIIILSALISEGGTYYSADLIEYYLNNLSQVDMMQDSGDAIPYLNAAAQSTIERKGTPVSFYKYISQQAANNKNSKAHRPLEFCLIFSVSAIITIFIALYICLNYKPFLFKRPELLSLADSSPPVFC